MKNTINSESSPISNSNAQQATERAQSSNLYAKIAREFRDKFYSKTELFGKWNKIMIDSPVILLSCAFFVLAIVEIIISWKMYGNLQSSIFTTPNPFLSAFIGGMVVFVGAVVSHYIAKRLSGSLFDLEVFNLMHDTPSLIHTVAEEKVRIKTWRHFMIGIILFIILIVGVYSISSDRVGLMGTIQGREISNRQKYLPVIVVILEVFCGIYLGYFFRRIITKFQIKKLGRQFEKNKTNCAYETRMVKNCYDHASQRGEHISYNRDLRDALYRFEFRGQDNNNYVDEIPESKNVKIMVVEEGKPKTGVHVFGILPGRVVTNGNFTNDQGQAILEWDGEMDFLEGIMVERKPHHGPFNNRSSVMIDLKGEDATPLLK